MDLNSAGRFAQSWFRAWNAHDLDAVLARFADDVVFCSPVAARVATAASGVNG